jgi:hypothetical protein
MVIFANNLDHEYSPSGAFLLRRKTRGNHGGGSQDAVWNSATSGEWSNFAIGGTAWSEIVQSPALRADTQRR